MAAAKYDANSITVLEDWRQSADDPACISEVSEAGDSTT